MNWVNQKDNGFSQSKSIGKIKYTCKILPSSYLALRDISVDQNLSNHNFEDIKLEYDSSLVLLFNLSPLDPNEEWDVMTANVDSYETFREKVEKMNFGMKEKFEFAFISKNTRENPVIVNLENDYGITKGRNMMVVFDLHGETQNNVFKEEFLISFDDDIFQGGRMEFIFDDMNSLPNIKVKK